MCKKTEKDYFANRRTIRSFMDQPVSDELLTDLIERAAHAPTTGNMQLCSVVVTRKPGTITALAPAHFNQPASVGCSAMLTFCADLNRFEKWCRARDARPGFENLQSLMAAVFDAVIFAQQFVTVAEMSGLGTCYLGTTTYNAQMVADILKLPERVVPVLTVAVGWPADEGEDSGRLPVEAIMHFEQYNNYTAEDINRLYSGKEAREDSRRFVAENGKQTLAQVFTDIRYPQSSSDAFSATFNDFLRKNRFI